jgi:hypothetical protein
LSLSLSLFQSVGSGNENGVGGVVAFILLKASHTEMLGHTQGGGERERAGVVLHARLYTDTEEVQQLQRSVDLI